MPKLIHLQLIVFRVEGPVPRVATDVCRLFEQEESERSFHLQ